MAAIGFSLNNLTLFGLVLAIGIVVDDAIVVVEAVEHHIEQGLSPKQAAIRAMEQVSGPVIAVALVLSAVFIPCAFISGITGQFFRQFALTIAVSTIISAFNSLTLSPALAALFLQHDPLEKTGSAGCSIWFLVGFSAYSTGASATPPALHAPGRSVLARQRRGADPLRSTGRIDRGGLQLICRRATFPSHGPKAICTSASSCPTPPPWSGPRQSSITSTRSVRETPGVVHTISRRRPIVHARRQRLQLRQPFSSRWTPSTNATIRRCTVTELPPCFVNAIQREFPKRP